MEKVIHRADTRGYFNHGWLKTYHTFSFARYYDPRRVHFGALRVLNDDTVEGGEGFGTHPHDNMEIVSIPLAGALEHGDSMENTRIIRPGEIQVMTAGTGVMHSEFNHSDTEPVKFLQIWIFTDREGHAPRYNDIKLAPVKENELQLIVGPEGEGGKHVGWIHQKAWFYMAELEDGAEVEHKLHPGDNGVYLFVIKGKVDAAGESLSERDGMGVSQTGEIKIKAEGKAKVLLMEVPMLK